MEEQNLKDEFESLSEDQKIKLILEHYTNQFVHLLSNYEGSKKQLINTWVNSAFAPLQKEEITFAYPEEKRLFDLFSELNGAKFLLMVHGLAQQGIVQILKPLIPSVESVDTNNIPVEEQEKIGDDDGKERE